MQENNTPTSIIADYITNSDLEFIEKRKSLIEKLVTGMPSNVDYVAWVEANKKEKDDPNL